MLGDNVGSIEYSARINTSRLRGDAAETDAIVKNTGDNVEKTGERSFSGFSKFAKVGLAAAAAAVATLGTVIAVNMGDAVRRVDTLNNSARTFENMGFKVKDVKKAMEALDKSIRGLPTSLDEGVRGMTMLAATYQDVGLGQKVFTSLNNAILGFGGNTEEVSNAVAQLSQLPMDGPLDAQTWNSLRNSGLTPVLVAMSKDMGISINEMKDRFGEGQLTVKDFTDKLVEMNEKGGGGMKSLSQIAKDSTSGIGTGWQNMNTAIQRGIAAIVEYIGSENIANFLSGVGKAFEDIAKAVPPAIEIVKGFLTDIIKFMKPVTDFIANNKEAWDVLKMALLAIAIVIGLIIVAVGIGLVGAFALIMGIINVAIWIVTKFIEWLQFMGDGIAAVIWWFVQFDAKVREVIATFVTNVGRGLLDVIDWFKKLPGAIMNTIGDAGKWLYNIGKDMMQGLINGIQDMVKNVQKVAGNIGKSVQDKFKSVMGINSPSTVFAMYGKNIAQGLSIGINNNAGLANNSISSMINGISPPSMASSMSLNSLGTLDSATRSGSSSVTINLSGIMTRSKSDERDIAKTLIQRVNEELSAKNQPLIGGGAI